MAWTSSLPGAMDALVTTFAEWPGLDGVTVRDGPSTSQATVQEVVSVGYTGSEDEGDADSSLVAEGLGGERDREQVTIRCAVAVLKSSDDIPGARRRAYELLSQAGAALASNRTLNGNVMQSMIASHSLSMDLTPKGAQAVVVFDVSCDAYTGA